MKTFITGYIEQDWSPEQISGYLEKSTEDSVSHETIELLRPYRNDAAHTITADNGKEFSEHESISKKLNVDFYFAHPYSSWERGTNENMNGFIRQYFPKKSSFEKITEKDLEFVADRLNNRPRKCLGYRTPNQVFNAISHFKFCLKSADTFRLPCVL